MPAPQPIRSIRDWKRSRPRKVADHTCKLVKQTFERIHREQMCYVDIELRSGVPRNTFSSWSDRSVPLITNLDAVLNVLGYELTITEIKEQDDA